jgi:hypothetical protein
MIAAFGGPALTCGAFIFFFGGSSRDPGWMWLLYSACFYGGMAAGVAGLAALIAVAFVKPTDGP